MSREAHVRVCEGLGVKAPRATRLNNFMDNQEYYQLLGVEKSGDIKPPYCSTKTCVDRMSVRYAGHCCWLLEVTGRSIFVT